MTENVLRARSVTELVDAAVQLFRRHYSSLVIVSGIGMSPLLLARPLAQHMIIGDGDSFNPLGILGGLAINLVALIWTSLASAAIITAASQGYLEGHVDVASAIRQVLSRMGAVLYSSFIKGFIMFLGAFLLVVGLFYFYATYFAVPSTVMLEKLTGDQGLLRSSQLAKGNRWHVLKTMMLVYGIYLIISLGASGIARIMFGASNITLSAIFSTVVTIFIFPVVPITEMLVYYDLRIRMEGYDVEVMAARLDAAASPASPVSPSGL